MFIHGSQAFFWVARVEVTLGKSRLDAFVLLNSLLAVVKLNFLKNELLVLRNFQAKQFEVKIKVADRSASRLIILKMQPLHVRMSERLINRYPASRVKRKHLLDQVDCVFIGSSEQFVEVLAACARKLAHKGTIVIILNLVDESRVRFSNQIRDHHHLFLLRLCRQEWLSSNQLSQNTTNTPYVDGRSILAPG